MNGSHRPRRRTVPLLGTAVTALLGLGTPYASADSLPHIAQEFTSGQSCVRATSANAPGMSWPSLSYDLGGTWQLSQGSGVTVAVIDTGVAASGVPQLSGQVSDGPRIKGPAGTDCVGHGTFVAGLIAGRAAATGFSGVAPRAHVLSLAVTDDQGATTPALIATGIDAAVAGGARVIDVSVPTATPSKALASAVKRAIAAGSLVVAPATFDGQSRAGLVYPAAYPGVLSVTDTPADGSAAASGTQVAGAPVDLAAPGDGVTGPGPGGGGFSADGPSYATAFVAGTAALVDAYRGPTSPARLIQRLEATAVHPAAALPDASLGYGTVDPQAAVSGVLSDRAASRHAAAGERLTLPPPRHRTAGRTALLVAGGTFTVVVLVGLGALTATTRRRRLGQSTDDIDPDGTAPDANLDLPAPRPEEALRHPAPDPAPGSESPGTLDPSLGGAPSSR
ncbi:S8 family serine peptidase [Streptomyces sp. IBSBF 2435]|uniref:S8 family serine peptidase n=1 Tax=Streptomyces sp. IBSBF 2435 TaxID=2903531 RepID=UPI002FDB9CCE